MTLGSALAGMCMVPTKFAGDHATGTGKGVIVLPFHRGDCDVITVDILLLLSLVRWLLAVAMCGGCSVREVDSCCTVLYCCRDECLLANETAAVPVRSLFRHHGPFLWWELHPPSPAVNTPSQAWDVGPWVSASDKSSSGNRVLSI